MRVQTTIPMAVLWFACVAGCQQEEQPQPDWEVQRHLQRGNQALSEDQLEVAEGEFKKVIELNPSHAGAHHKLARVLIRRTELDPRGKSTAYSKAIAALEKSVSLEPKGKLAWKDLARVCTLAGRIPDALLAYGKLIELDPADDQSRTAVARLHMESGKPGRAEAAFQEGLKRSPGSGVLLLEYGRFLLTRKQDDLAEKQFEKIQPTMVEYYEALDELGSLAARRGDFARVKKIYKQLTEINPTDYMAWELLAAVDEREKKFAQAEEKYRRSLEIDRLHMSAWLGLGRVLRAQDKREQAVYAFKKADGFVGTKPDQALELAAELSALGEPAWALSVLEKARIAATDKKLLSAIEEQIKKLSGTQK